MIVRGRRGGDMGGVEKMVSDPITPMGASNVSENILLLGMQKILVAARIRFQHVSIAATQLLILFSVLFMLAF